MFNDNSIIYIFLNKDKTNKYRYRWDRQHDTQFDSCNIIINTQHDHILL